MVMSLRGALVNNTASKNDPKIWYPCSRCGFVWKTVESCCLAMSWAKQKESCDYRAFAWRRQMRPPTRFSSQYSETEAWYLRGLLCTIKTYNQLPRDVNYQTRWRHEWVQTAALIQSELSSTAAYLTVSTVIILSLAFHNPHGVCTHRGLHCCSRTECALRS